MDIRRSRCQQLASSHNQPFNHIMKVKFQFLWFCNYFLFPDLKFCRSVWLFCFVWLFLFLSTCSTMAYKEVGCVIVLSVTQLQSTLKQYCGTNMAAVFACYPPGRWHTTCSTINSSHWLWTSQQLPASIFYCFSHIEWRQYFYHHDKCLFMIC